MLFTKGTFENGVFNAGSISHFTVAEVDLSGDVNFAAFVKQVQTVGSFAQIGVRGTSTRFALENNAVSAAELETLIRQLAGFTTATVVAFTY
jgi:acyl CoA:acetate/3-ketoacid CoA transferase